MQKCYKLRGDRNTKMNMGHGTKNNWPLPHKNMSPFWWARKKAFFLPPSPLYGPMSPYQQFFLWMLPLAKLIPVSYLVWVWLSLLSEFGSSWCSVETRSMVSIIDFRGLSAICTLSASAEALFTLRAFLRPDLHCWIYIYTVSIKKSHLYFGHNFPKS